MGGSLGLSATLPVGPIVGLVEEGSAFAEKVRMAEETGDTSQLTKEDFVALMRAGGAALLALPGLSTNVVAQYAWAPHWEAGVRLSGDSFRLFVRNQVLGKDRTGLQGTCLVRLPALRPRRIRPRGQRNAALRRAGDDGFPGCLLLGHGCGQPHARGPR